MGRPEWLLDIPGSCVDASPQKTRAKGREGEVGKISLEMKVGHRFHRSM